MQLKINHNTCIISYVFHNLRRLAIWFRLHMVCSTTPKPYRGIAVLESEYFKGLQRQGCCGSSSRPPHDKRLSSFGSTFRYRRSDQGCYSAVCTDPGQGSDEYHDCDSAMAVYSPPSLSLLFSRSFLSLQPPPRSLPLTLALLTSSTGRLYQGFNI